jgi:hypothetical protein
MKGLYFKLVSKQKLNVDPIAEESFLLEEDEEDV